MALWEADEGLGAEEAHGAHHVLATDRALGQLLGAGRAGGDVPALQQHALQRRRHADLAALFQGQVVHLCNGNAHKCLFQRYTHHRAVYVELVSQARH